MQKERKDKMKSYTFYLKNGCTFRVKGELTSVKINNITGEIVSYKFSDVENVFVVNLKEVIAIVEDIEEDAKC